MFTIAACRPGGKLPAKSSKEYKDVVSVFYVGSAALQVGDVIQEVNRKPVHTMSEFQTLMSKRGSDTLLLLVNRDGKTMFVAVNP